MEMDDKIKRINELYHKSKKEGLTEEEKQNRQSLDRIILTALRQICRQSLKMSGFRRQMVRFGS